MARRTPADQRGWTVDFTLALENRTGKYFIGKDIIADQRHLVADVRYWRASAPGDATPPGDALLRYGLKVEKRLYAHTRRLSLPLRKGARPTLFLDPYTVVMAELSARDIVLCHDLGPLTHPDLFTPWLTSLYRRAFHKIAAVKPRLVFVSRSSQRAFEELFGTDFSMSVIYPHLRADIGSTATARPSLPDAPFLLTVGSLGWRKNQLAAIRAFARSGLADRGARYVLCGAREPGWEAVVAAAAATPGVDLLPYVSDAELAWLYAEARGFVLTSRLEGFGMPIAEAISRDLLPIISRVSVLEEVAGDGAIPVDPDDEAEIAQAMIELWNMSPDEKQQRSAAMRTGIGRFTREKFADEWRQTLRRVSAG